MLIPTYPAAPYGENAHEISQLSDAANFLYLINSENYNQKQDFITAVSATNYDVILMDAFHNESTYTQAEIASLKTKQNGASRLVIAYMSIGEAEDYRFYWESSWRRGDPQWLDRENPDWAGNYKVHYWDAGWQSILYGSTEAYLDRILAAGFDGVYLDIIDGFEYYE